jgi:hypothetical protein
MSELAHDVLTRDMVITPTNNSNVEDEGYYESESEHSEVFRTCDPHC